MSVRTRETTITFDHPFHMVAADGALPAGTYRVVIDEEQILGLSFIAYRRTATVLQTPALAAAQGRSASLPTDQEELDGALAKDRQTSRASADAPRAGAGNPPTL